MQQHAKLRELKELLDKSTDKDRDELLTDLMVYCWKLKLAQDQ